MVESCCIGSSLCCVCQLSSLSSGSYTPTLSSKLALGFLQEKGGHGAGFCFFTEACHCPQRTS